MKRSVRIMAAILISIALFTGNFVPVIAEDLPDLQPVGIEVSTLYAGVTNTVNININPTPVPSFEVKLLANEEQVAIVTGYSAGTWPATVGIEWTPASAGDYTLTAIVDPDQVIDESNNDNNQVQQTVTVLSQNPITVKVRVEGKTDTFWTGEITFFNYSIDLQGDTYPIDHPTALGALKVATDGNPQALNVEYGMYGSTPDYAKSVNGDGEEDWNGWLYRVNWLQPNFGAAAYTLADGDEVLWYWGAYTAPPLRLTTTRTELTDAETFTAKVETFDGMAWSPLNGATVHVGGQQFTSDVDGEVKNISPGAGSYTVFAEKDTAAEYTRSNRVTVNVTQVSIVPGDANGDGNLDALDITKVERVIAGLDTPTPGADANQDGSVNALDITKTERLIAGLDK